MKPVKVEILEELLQALNQKTFDLDAWKIRSVLILKKIFGDRDPKVGYIEQLRYDYSSWALRDHSGGVVHDPVKDKAREIIETALIELKLEESDPVMNALSQTLSGLEMDQLKGILDKGEAANNELKDFLENLPSGKTIDILARFIRNRDQA
ncbi:MAG TPA: hypothetical protein PLK12_17020 [Prolixibacteraceae bacterium]|nr:hypothetical protein [Prolixibacteraceae bacterium]